MAGSKMKAVVFKEPFRVAVEDRPIPETQHPSDVIVKISYTALCGSDLHIFRVDTLPLSGKRISTDAIKGARRSRQGLHHGSPTAQETNLFLTS